ncbi:hypothetical protein [Maribacter sp. 4G9]|uniref:hypothetical protein n=1 Tax=Maribacter sp. 4G9 TaxID=1889777 RepID=UPI000C1491F1|nr:hypothetical protein [Maribacter sp. 4G9]PIB37842.1 hypothetical protein BFP75_19510 [Maribacter sp. 4G9]
MQKFGYFLVLLLILVSCKEGVQETAIVEESSFGAMANELPKVVSVNAKAKAILDGWKDYSMFHQGFERIYTIDTREDLVLVIDDLVEKQKALENSEYPAEFDIPQIKGRQKVVKTYILKTKGDLEYRLNPETSIKELITAYNALRDQFNVTVNNTLPAELLETNEL